MGKEKGLLAEKKKLQDRNSFMTRQKHKRGDKKEK